MSAPSLKAQFLGATRLAKAEALIEWLDELKIEHVTNNNGIHIRIYREKDIINIWPTAEKLHVIEKGNKKYTPSKIILGNRYIADYIEEIANEL